MIRIMIVEDEPPINRLLQTLIEGYGCAYQIVAAVYNGQEALDVVEELKPDVIFTDIKMPRVDGLALTKQVHLLCPETLIVAISGYSDYETMRSMLQQNVFDYLLKPIQIKTFGDLLQRVSKACEERKQQQITQFFLQMIKDGIHNHNAQMTAALYNHFVVGIGCIGSYPASQIHSYVLENDIWSKKQLFRRFDSYDVWQFAGATNVEQIFILGFPDSSETEIQNACAELYESISTKYPLTILFGKPIRSVTDVGVSVNLLRNMLPMYIRIGQSQLFTFCDIQTAPCIPDYSLSREQQTVLQFCMKQQKQEAFHHAVQEIFRDFLQKQPSQYCVTQVLKWIVQCLESQILENSSYDRYYADLLIDEAILNAFDYSILEHSFFCICDDIFRIIDQSRRKSTGLRDLVTEIAEYLESNYDQPITNTSLEKHFLFSSSYIAKVFKKQKGVSPNKYLLQFRAKKACELIAADPNITAKQLSEALGFSDPLYIYKFIKNETGYTLSEYKNIIGQKAADQ